MTNRYSRAPSASSTSTVATTSTTQTAASTASTSVPVSIGTSSYSNAHPRTGYSVMGPASVRRTLFHHHLSRRPASATSSTSAPSTVGVGTSTSNNLDNSRPASVSATAVSAPNSRSADSGDIVPRDKNGNYKIDIPILPPVMMGDGGDEAGMEDIEDARPNAESGNTGVSGSAAETDLGGREKEKIEASLVEMMYRNRSRQLSSEPAEILNLIHQRLRSKVAALDEDNWMYEVEDDVRV